MSFEHKVTALSGNKGHQSSKYGNVQFIVGSVT